MVIYIDATTKEIQMRKGDTGNIPFTFKNLPSGTTYKAFLAIDKGDDRATIVKEFSPVIVVDNAVSFPIDVTNSDALPVGEMKYSVKLCYTNSEGFNCEDTVLPRKDDTAPDFIVLDKTVEGE